MQEGALFIIRTCTIRHSYIEYRQAPTDKTNVHQNAGTSGCYIPIQSDGNKMDSGISTCWAVRGTHCCMAGLLSAKHNPALPRAGRSFSQLLSYYRRKVARGSISCSELTPNTSTQLRPHAHPPRLPITCPSRTPHVPLTRAFLPCPPDYYIVLALVPTIHASSYLPGRVGELKKSHGRHKSAALHNGRTGLVWMLEMGFFWHNF